MRFSRDGYGFVVSAVCVHAGGMACLLVDGERLHAYQFLVSLRSIPLSCVRPGWDRRSQCHGWAPSSLLLWRTCSTAPTRCARSCPAMFLTLLPHFADVLDFSPVMFVIFAHVLGFLLCPLARFPILPHFRSFIYCGDFDAASLS